MTNNLTTIAKNLRNRSTEAERLLWRYLRKKTLAELKFRRQQPIGKYVIDFVCFDKRVVVEIDGGQHSKDKDFRRDNWLQKQGFRVLRVWNNEVLRNLEGVLEKIRQVCFISPSP